MENTIHMEANYILTESGIYDFNSQEMLETPFSRQLVHHGGRSDNQIAVIANREEIWIRNKN